MKRFKYMLFGCMAIVSPAFANTPAPLSDEQMHAGMCIIANQGTYTAMSERQAGHSKAQAQAVLQADFGRLRLSFKNEQFLQGIASAWALALEEAYNTPIATTPSEKEAVVSQFTETAFLSCMDTLSNAHP